MKRSYHHGDLRQALIDSALEVLAEKGVDAFSLRETARRVGVSPAAYKHHFADTRALLTALAALAFTRLANLLEQACATAGRKQLDRLKAQAAAYLDFALAEPALFDLMWRTPLLDLSDPMLAAEKTRAFECLDRVVRGPDAPRVPPDDPAMAPTITCWSLVHGFARLVLDGTLGHDGDARTRAASRLLPVMLDLVTIPDDA
jgi:AcrR family transcriptional regulator